MRSLGGAPRCDQSLRIAVGDATLHVARHGDHGPAVILLHGLGGSHESWHPVATGLGNTCRVLVPDLRGCGSSERGSQPYTLDRLAADVVGVADALHLDSFAVVGHSLGGVIAQAVLTRPDHRVRAAVLVATSSRLRPEATANWLRVARAVERQGVAESPEAHARAYSEAFATAHPEIVKRHAALAAATDRHVYAAQARAASDYDFTATLATVMQPVLILQGLADRLTPPGGAVILSRALPHATLELIEGVGHNLPAEMGEAFVSRVASFLAAHA